MKSLFLKSAIALSLAASPTIALAQEARPADEQRAIGALFVAALFAVVLLAYADEGKGSGDDIGVSP